MGRRKHRGKALVAGWWRVLAIVSVPAARSVEITTPQAEGQVSEVERVAGAVRDLQPGEVVWVLVRRSGAAEPFFPAAGPCPSVGATWACPEVRIGGPAPTGTFELTPVIVDGQGQQALVDYLRSVGLTSSGRGLSQLPEGVVQEGTSIRVSRAR
jgi:hypothetical protein